MTTVTENLDRIQKREAIVAFLAYECEVHPGRNVSDTMINAYEMVLSDYDISALTAAFKKVIETETFFPTPAHIIRAMSKKKEEKIKDNAASAWSIVLGIAARGGMYCTPCFADKYIHEALQQVGGWRAFCQSEEKNLKWAKRDFQENYCSAVRRGAQAVTSTLKRNRYGEEIPEVIPCGYLHQPDDPTFDGQKMIEGENSPSS